MNIQQTRNMSTAHRLFLTRADGTIRAVETKEPGQDAITAMYVPGTVMRDNGSMPDESHRCYHWASTFTDEELEANFEMSQYEIAHIRREALCADMNRRHVAHD